MNAERLESSRPTPSAPPGFAWSAEEVRRVAGKAADLVAQYLEHLPHGPVFRPVPAEHAAFVADAALPTTGTGIDELLDEFSRDIAAFPFGNGHPRFFGWVNSPPAPVAIVAELLAAAMNPSVAGGNHAAVYVEHAVIKWFKTLLGFPENSGGLLVSGGSAAALTALSAARHFAAERAGWSVRHDGLQGVRAPLVVYKGAEGHGCHQKAIELLGIGSANLRTVPSDSALRMIPEELDRMVREDMTAGLTPMAVIASAGTVNTGAIDPIAALADVCEAHGVWLHVDGAYGAPAILAAAYRDPLSAIARADSVVVDPHKWLYVPIEAGLVLVRDARRMRDAFSLVPPYLRTDGNVHGVQGPPWFSEYGVQQTRGFRALKVWMALRYFGLDGYRELIEHDLAMSGYLADSLRALPAFEVREPTSMSIVCFRHVPTTDRTDTAHLDALNKAVLADLQLGGEAFLSSTMLDGHFWLRACFVNPLTTIADVDRLLDALVAASTRAEAR